MLLTGHPSPNPAVSICLRMTSWILFACSRSHNSTPTQNNPFSWNKWQNKTQSIDWPHDDDDDDDCDDDHQLKQLVELVGVPIHSGTPTTRTCCVFGFGMLWIRGRTEIPLLEPFAEFSVQWTTDARRSVGRNVEVGIHPLRSPLDTISYLAGYIRKRADVVAKDRIVVFSCLCKIQLRLRF